MLTSVTEYALEITSRDQLRPKHTTTPGVSTREAIHPLPELNRFFYRAIGGDWYWVDRLDWTYDQWAAWVDRDELRTWIAYLDDTPAGYFELQKEEEDNIQIAYFGLLSRFFGKGLGSHLLTMAIEEAWNWGAKRVWVHTCTLDSEAALQNYQARGFKVFNQRTFMQDLPDDPPGPWTGAR